MPLPMQSLKDAAAELGIPENELRVMVQTNKVRAVMRKGTLCIAPDEIAKIRRLRKTALDSTYRPGTPKPAAPAKPTTAGPAKPASKTAAPPRTTSGTTTTRAPIPKPAGLKLPEPPPK